jgi:DNA-binding transcriptional LysR family regulator
MPAFPSAEAITSRCRSRTPRWITTWNSGDIDRGRSNCYGRHSGTVARVQPEVRQLQYFVAVAEELNFTRAAERLHVVQQSLSTAIAQLEASLGIRLFERTTRSVNLTGAGAAWLSYAREALASMNRAADAAEDLSAGRSGRLRVGLAATGALSFMPVLLRTFRERYPLADVDSKHFGFQDPCGGLRDQQTDVAIVRPPFLDDGLTLVVLGQEPRYVVLASDHPLSQRGAVDFADLIDEPWMDVETDPLWCDFWKVSERRTRPPVIGAMCRTLDDLFEAARAGTAMGLVPESIAQTQSWPNLAFVAVRDIAPSTVAVARHTDDASPLVANFVELAKEVSSLPPVTGPDAQVSS